MKHEHEFFEITTVNRHPDDCPWLHSVSFVQMSVPNGVTTMGSVCNNVEYGVKAGCILCGEMRTLWANGELEIKNHANKKPRKTKAKTNPPSETGV